MSSGQAQTVGLLPVFGACSTSSYRRGLPRLCPLDSIRMLHAPWSGAVITARSLTPALLPAKHSQDLPGPDGPQGTNKLLLNWPSAQAGASQLQMVTYTGGRNRDGGTPAVGERIRCMASGVPRKRRSELAATLRLWRSSRVACQQPATGVPGTSASESSPRRTCWVTRCSTAGATPAPSAAAAQAAVWLGNTPIRLSGMRSAASNWPVSLPGSVPDGSTSHRHWRALPFSLDSPAVTTTRRYRKFGSHTTGTAGSGATAGPMATSASRFATSTPISWLTATPADTST